MSFFYYCIPFITVIWIMRLLDELYQERTALAIKNYVVEKSFIFQCYIHTLEIQCMGSRILSLRQEIRHQGCRYLFSGASSIQWNFMCVPVLKRHKSTCSFKYTLSFFLIFFKESEFAPGRNLMKKKTFPELWQAPSCIRGAWWPSASSDTRQNHLHGRVCASRDLIILSQGVTCPWGGRILCSLL